MGTYFEVDGNNFRELSTRPREDEQTNRGVLKWFTRSVLKTDDRETDPGVRIRPPLQNYAMLEFKTPIPVIVEGNKEGYAVYVSNGGSFENDIWCIVLCDGGHIRHYRSDQIRMHHNATLDLTKHNEKGNK